MSFNKTEEKGITLVALVITIIILLILAGVAISQLIGNGLFEKTKLAKEKHENAQELENSVLSDYENQINNLGSVSSSRTETSSGYSATKLWEYNSSATDVNNGLQTGTITLSDSIQNYDEVVVTGQYYGSDTNYGQACNVRILKENYYIDAYTTLTGLWNHIINVSLSDTTRRIVFGFESDNQLNAQITSCRLMNVYGIKY